MKRLSEIYFKCTQQLEDLEFDRQFYENFYVWGRGKEYRAVKLKLAIIERLWNKVC